MTGATNIVREPNRDRRRIDDIETLLGVREPLYRNFRPWPGGDLFLAISGFVIARSLLPMLDGARGKAEFLNLALAFWVRRAWRLLGGAGDQFGPAAPVLVVPEAHRAAGWGRSAVPAGAQFGDSQ